ncbi:hypothetical protein FW774_04105 (plasmid) [Pedobacter sp. BS3]|uniref:hypothetical protein n=1 Tax=Pedobacter sp. BS3 TaxID=2567937 RepID=UPI0011EF752B|nr:hypothetical protein [Pedobacter sp. BS3]TZF86237.1 hypothetical protein FW774_04105 [Pedobacter sp. BS3]
MKTLRFNFCHPVQGKIKFLHPSNKKLNRVKTFNTGTDNLLEVCMDKFKKGPWKLLLEWEHNGMGYVHQKDVVVT